MITIERSKTPSYFYVLDWQVMTKYSQIFFSVIINPILCLACLAINILSIVVLQDKEIKKTKTYHDLQLHFIFVSIYMFISFFKLLFICIDEKNLNDNQLGIKLCIPAFQTSYASYFNVIVIRLIGGSMKTASTICYTLFTLRRYIIVSETNNKYLNYSI